MPVVAIGLFSAEKWQAINLGRSEFTDICFQIYTFLDTNRFENIGPNLENLLLANIYVFFCHLNSGLFGNIRYFLKFNEY